MARRMKSASLAIGGDREVLVGALFVRRRLVAAGVLAAQRVDFLREALDVAEVAIDRRESHVRDLIDRAQLRQHLLADLARRNLTEPELADLPLDLERQLLHL